MTRNYEMVVILDPELKGEEQEKLLTKIEKLVSEAEGKISEKKDWGRKELAYPIAKKKEGLLFLFNFFFPPDKIVSFQQKLRQEEKILRYLIVNRR